MRNIWYYFWHRIVTIGLYFTFRKRKAYHLERIPKDKPIIYVANHQNALVDAIMIPTLPSQVIHFITRSDVFKNPLADKFLRSINMLPIYRLRDGRDKLAKNVEILDHCANVLNKNGRIQLFPEGNHGLQRRVRPFKKGFADIAFLALDKNPDLPVQIVPVGINYDSKDGFPASVALYYGKPIDARTYYQKEDRKASILELTKTAQAAVEKLTTHIVPKEEYDFLLKQLEDDGIDFLNPKAANDLIASRDFSEKYRVPNKRNWWRNAICFLFSAISILPLLLWWRTKKGIKDKAFVNTFRFAFVVAVFSMYHLAIGWAINHYFGQIYGVGYLGVVLLLAILRKHLPVKYLEH